MEQTLSAKNPLGTEKIGKLIARFAVPSIIALVVNSLYNMVDQIFIGNGVGYLGNAATNVILPLMTVVLAVGLMIGDGCAALMGLSMGKGDPEKASKCVGNATVLTLVFGVAYTALVLIFLEPLCWLFGATKQSISYCLEYGGPIILGSTFLAVDNAFTPIIRADGRANVSLIGMLIGCITNVILDPIFIFVFKWGVGGAAWATIVGQFLNAVYFIVCMTRCKTVKLKKEHFKLDGKICGKMCVLGLSSFITQFALVIVIATVNNTLKACGVNAITVDGATVTYGPDIPVSAMGVVMKVSQILVSVVLGLATGILPVVSYNYGSKQYDRVKKLYKYALLIGTIVMVVACVVLEVFPAQIVSIFGEQDDPLYMSFAKQCMQIYMAATFTVGVSIVTGIFFQSIDKPVQSMVLSLLRQIVVLVPAVLLLGLSGNVITVLWAGPISDGVACIASLVTIIFCWKRIFNKEKANEKNNNNG